MRLTTKIGAGFLTLAGLLAALSWSQLALIDRLYGESRELSEVSLETAGSSVRLRGEVARLRELSLKSLVLDDPAYAAEVERLREVISRDLASLSSRSLTAAVPARSELAPVERRATERLAASWVACVDAATPQPGESRSRHRERLAASFEPVDRDLGRLTAAARATLAARVAESGARVAEARFEAWAATLTALLVAVVISLAIVASVIRPLHRLGRGARALAGGDFEHRVPPAGGPELAALAEDFNAMASQLGQLDRLKRDFLANVSHDLKTPLASIQEATRLLLEELPGPLSERQRRLLALNLKSGERLFRLIEDLLHLSKLEAGTMEYSPRRQDLADLARSALGEVGALVREAEVEVTEDLPADPVTVACDGAAVLKVLHNLLSNAVKFTPAGGAIDLRIGRVSHRADLPAPARERCPGESYLPAALVEVRDSGPGVPDEHKEKIFDRFYRVDTGDGPPGTGLGLAIVREIVDGHGGELWIEDGPQGGSVFRVVLWASPPTEGRSSTAAAPVAGKARGAASLVAVGLLAAVLSVGCKSAPQPVAPPPPPPVVQAPPAAEPGPLELGDAAFERGDYEAASAAYEGYLASGPEREGVDRVVFRLAMVRMLPGSPAHQAPRGRQLLRELVEHFPGSPWRPFAEYLLGMQREIEVLRRQLEEIKRIDLEPSGD